ncbi:hypothetical protein RQP46_000973 [Phenoliferia psychrophenolica]
MAAPCEIVAFWIEERACVDELQPSRGAYFSPFARRFRFLFLTHARFFITSIVMHLSIWTVTLVACFTAVSAFELRAPTAGGFLSKRRTEASPCGHNVAGKDFHHSAKKGCVECGHSTKGQELYLTASKTCVAKCPSGFAGDHRRVFMFTPPAPDYQLLEERISRHSNLDLKLCFGLLYCYSCLFIFSDPSNGIVTGGLLEDGDNSECPTMAIPTLGRRHPRVLRNVDVRFCFRLHRGHLLVFRWPTLCIGCDTRCELFFLCIPRIFQSIHHRVRNIPSLLPTTTSAAASASPAAPVAQRCASLIGKYQTSLNGYEGSSDYCESPNLDFDYCSSDPITHPLNSWVCGCDNGGGSGVGDNLNGGSGGNAGSNAPDYLGAPGGTTGTNGSGGQPSSATAGTSTPAVVGTAGSSWSSGGQGGQGASLGGGGGGGGYGGGSGGSINFNFDTDGFDASGGGGGGQYIADSVTSGSIGLAASASTRAMVSFSFCLPLQQYSFGG